MTPGVAILVRLARDPRRRQLGLGPFSTTGLWCPLLDRGANWRNQSRNRRLCAVIEWEGGSLRTLDAAVGFLCEKPPLFCVHLSLMLQQGTHSAYRIHNNCTHRKGNLHCRHLGCSVARTSNMAAAPFFPWRSVALCWIGEQNGQDSTSSWY